VKGEYKLIQAYPLDFFLKYTVFYVIVYTLAIFNLGKNIMFHLFKRDLRGWCWQNFWVWHFLHTLQSDSPLALY